MRGGGIGATAKALFLALCSGICAAPMIAPLDANPAEAPRANAVAGSDKARETKAIFSAVFNIESFLRVYWNAIAYQSDIDRDHL
jgi:hypothetical protein